MKKIILLLLVSHALQAQIIGESQEIAINNTSNEDMWVNVADDIKSHKQLIKANTWGFIRPWMIATWLPTLIRPIEYITVHIATGPFKGLGVRWNITQEWETIVPFCPSEEHKTHKYFAPRKINNKKANFDLTLSIKRGLPNIDEVYQVVIATDDNAAISRPFTHWKMVSTRKEIQKAYEIVRKQQQL